MRRHVFSGAVGVLMTLSVVLAPTALPIRITGFSVNLPGTDLDDAIGLWNNGTHGVDLSRVEVSDGTGRLAFPSGANLAPGERIVVAGNATAYFDAAGSWPDFAIHGLGAPRTLVALKSNFALSQDGDLIRVDFEGVLQDIVVYGDEAYTGAGWSGSPVRIASGTFLRWFPRVAADDHDAAPDWESPRRAYLGQDLFPPSVHPLNQTIVAYSAPEHSRDLVRIALEAATTRLRVNVYQFRDLEIADLLVGLMQTKPGLRVHVLVDEQPVGESRVELSDRGHVLLRLANAGAEVGLLQHSRYAFDHAKYVIADDEWILVQSENFVPSGIPVDRAGGNRGWGLLVRDAGLAKELARVFDADTRLHAFGARARTADDAPSFPPLVAAGDDVKEVPTPSTSMEPGEATLIVGPLDPGAPDPVVAAIANATREILVAQLNFPPVWRDASGREWPHPYVDAIRRAANRGVTVRLLLDGHFLDGESNAPDNQGTSNHLDPHPKVTVRIVPDHRPVLHAKGLIVDDEYVLVGSMNWNLNSMVQNREVDLLLRHPPSARFFRGVFETDWAAAISEPDGAPGPASLATLFIFAILIRALRPRSRTR